MLIPSYAFRDDLVESKSSLLLLHHPSILSTTIFSSSPSTSRPPSTKLHFLGELYRPFTFVESSQTSGSLCSSSCFFFPPTFRTDHLFISNKTKRQSKQKYILHFITFVILTRLKKKLTSSFIFWQTYINFLSSGSFTLIFST